MAKKICYGGAFDIDPYSFWCRDDIDAFQGELEQLPSIQTNGIIIRKGYIDDNVLQFDFEHDENEYTVSQKIDMRKIQSPNDLVSKYLSVLEQLILDKCGLTAAP